MMSESKLKDAKCAKEQNPTDSLRKLHFILSTHHHDPGKSTLLTSYVGPIPECQGYNAILVIIDWLTKAVKYKATHGELNSERFTKILQDQVICDHRLPHWIIHDRDTRFMSMYIKELFTILGTKQNPSSAYHPTTDRQTK